MSKSAAIEAALGRTRLAINNAPLQSIQGANNELIKFPEKGNYKKVGATLRSVYRFSKFISPLSLD